MSKVALLVLSKVIRDLTKLRDAVDKHAPEDFELYIHKDFSSKLENYHGIILPFQTRARWGSPELAFAQLESFKEIFERSDAEYAVSISDDSIPVGNWYSKLKYISNYFESSVIQGFYQEGLDNVGRNFGITSKSEAGIWHRKFPLPIYKGAQWIAITRRDFERVWEGLERNPDLIQELYHTEILDERLFPTLFEFFKLPYVNKRIVYAPFSDDKKTGRLVSAEELRNIRETEWLFARKFNWDDEISQRIEW